MTNEIQNINQDKKSIVNFLASKYEMEPAAFQSVIKETVMPGNVKNEEMASFLLVAKEYDLNPLTKEIYAFPGRGKITPIVSVDGWAKIINSHPQLDGIEFIDNNDGSNLISVECKIYRKDRKMPICASEYMAECKGPSEPWKKWPRRMLRHKALIQAARYAFSFSGIYDPDEAERIKDVTPQSPLTPVHSTPDLNAAMQQIEEPKDKEVVVDENQIEMFPSLLDDYRIRIKKTSSKTVLKQIGQEIAESGMSESDKEEIKELYSTKLNLLKND
jgi:phage recombination protein Bet